MFFLLITRFFLLSCVAVPHASVTLEIDRVYIIEDRDYGAGEIYLKVTVGVNQPLISSIYSDINDGGTLQLDWLVFSGESNALTVRIDVWESDDDYNEASNDFLGQVSLSWDCQNAFAGWYNCEDPSGGNYLLQAQVYVIANVEESVTPTETTAFIPTSIITSSQISPEASFGMDLIIVLGIIFTTAIIIAFLFSLRSYRRSTQQRETISVAHSKEFTVYEPKSVTSKPLSPATQPFFCQLCGEKHPAGSPRFQCDACARMICDDAYDDMVGVGRSSCPMCGGNLRRV